MDLGLTVEIDRVCDEITVINNCLDLDGKDILELGCGRAELTRAIASAGQNRKILALEVDETQHQLNLKIDDLPGVRFGLGGCEAIPLADDSVDIALMFKSLHHVPIDLMDQALAELARVLRPGGYATISEPIFRGSLNEVIRIFHDESKVRLAAFNAIARAVESGLFELDQEIFFKSPRRFQDFSEFERRVIGATHSHHQLSDEQLQRVRETFDRCASPDGCFQSPVRVDLLRRPN